MALGTLASLCNGDRAPVALVAVGLEYRPESCGMCLRLTKASACLKASWGSVFRLYDTKVYGKEVM